MAEKVTDPYCIIKPLSSSSLPPNKQDIPISEIYKFSKLPNTEFGIEGYETPVIHFDHIRKIEEDKLYKLRSKGKKPRAGKIDMNAKRGGLTHVVEKQALTTPGPWAYDIKQEWLHGNKIDVTKIEVPVKEKQEMEFKWKGVPKEDREFKPRPKSQRTKLDMSVNSRLKAGEEVLLHRLGNYGEHEEGLSTSRPRRSFS